MSERKLKLDGTPRKSPAGRPPLEFTPAQIAKIDKMAYRQARDYTIAEAMGLEIETFRLHFSKRCSQKRAEGKLQLHTTQFQMARKQPVMAIWLGKQHLEQTDRQDHTHNVTAETAKLLGLIDGSGKGRLPASAEVEEAGQSLVAAE